MSSVCPFHGSGSEASPREQDACPPAMTQKCPALMHKDTRRCPGCWEVMVRSGGIGVAASNLAVMEKSRHTPAYCCCLENSRNSPSKAVCNPRNPLSSPVPAAEGSWRGSGDTAHRDATGTPKMRCIQISLMSLQTPPSHVCQDQNWLQRLRMFFEKC